MDFNFLSPFVRYAADLTMNSSWLLKERVIFDYELLFVKEGEIEVTVEEQVYRGIPGDLFLFRPKQRHSIKVMGGKPFRQPHIHFDAIYEENSKEVRIIFTPIDQIQEHERTQFRKDIFLDPVLQLPSLIRPENPMLVEKMVLDIIQEYQMKKPFYEISLKGMLNQLLVHLIRENYWRQNPNLLSNLKELSKAQDYLKHHAGRKVSLEELSKISNISKFYLVSLFTKAFGMGPIQYHQMIRIEKAKEMLRFTDMAVTNIADELGFPNIHSFSRSFRRVEGVPPSYYRRTK